MNIKLGLLASAGFAALTLAAPSHAALALNGGCTSDLTLTVGSSLVACYGRYDDNQLNNNNNSTINEALTALGFVGNAVQFDLLPAASKISGLGGNTSVNFPGVLNGIVFLGLHFGNGQGGPGNTTTFYKINAVNLDIITLNLNASSNAVILAAAPAVPEPAAWAMMLGGFGLLGATMRRRQRTAVTFA
jgi:hypothetical protein